MKLTMSTRSLTKYEKSHVYGNHTDGWEVVLTSMGASAGHLIFPHMFSNKTYTLEECLDFIQRTMDAGKTGWAFDCSCCGHTSDTNIREDIA